MRVQPEHVEHAIALCGPRPVQGGRCVHSYTINALLMRPEHHEVRRHRPIGVNENSKSQAHSEAAPDFCLPPTVYPYNTSGDAQAEGCGQHKDCWVIE